MSTITKQFTKEQLVERAKYGIERYTKAAVGFPRHMDVAMDLELARIALASLEAEPVAYMYKDNLHTDARFSLYKRFGNWSQEDINEYEITEIPLYAAPPAPVSLLDERYQHLSELYHAQKKRLFKIAQRIKGPSFDKYAYYPSQAMDVLESAIFGESKDACRAAMIQGADGNSPAIPDGWVACSERMPDNGGESRRLYLCWGTYHDGDEPGHIPAWLFIHPTYGWYEWQPVEDDCNPKSVVITHWMSLPAAPQQDEASSNVIDTYRGSDGKPTVIPDAYEIKSFGFFSAAVGDDDLILQIEKFSFDSGGISQPEIDDFVPRLALQAIINKLQEHCDKLGNRPLDNVLLGLGRDE